MITINKKEQTNEPAKVYRQELNQLFLEELNEIYCAEQALIKALPLLAKGSNSRELTSTFDLYAAQTDEHLQKLNQIFRMLDKKPGKWATMMTRLIQEANMILSNTDQHPSSHDLRLIKVTRKIECYQIALYSSLCNMATKLGYYEASSVLETMIDQEKERDSVLHKLEGMYMTLSEFS